MLLFNAFVVLIYFVFVDCNIFRNDYTFHIKTDGWFKVHHIPATWHDAWLRCNLEGAVLASPLNEFMESALRDEMIRKRVTWNGIFSGVHATFSKGDFFSVEGVPLSKMPVDWMPYEPDNKNNDEQCILYVANGTIADVNCSEVHPYMCYKKKTKEMVFNECGTVDNGYTLDKRTGSCYKFHKTPRNWTRAFMACSAEGGYLAIPNSEVEAIVLRDLFARHPHEIVFERVPDKMREIMHIGFHDWAEKSIWTTIRGTPLQQSGYSIWNESQPDNAPPGEYCGGMFRNGKLDDVWCHERGLFTCEMDPVSNSLDKTGNTLFDLRSS